MENLQERPPIQNIHLDIHSISMARYMYVTAVMAFICAELCAGRQADSAIFGKTTSCDFTAFYSVLTQANIWFLRCATANLYPIMSHFDGLHFSGCRSEEVMFLLMLSVVEADHTVNKTVCHNFYGRISL